MKNLLTFAGFMAATTLLVFNITGCNNGSLPAGSATVGIEKVEITYNSVEVNFKPNSHTVSYNFAIGTADDMAAFENGTLDGIEFVSGAAEYNKTYEGLEHSTEYTIFAQGVNVDNEKGAVIYITVTTAQEIWTLTFEGALGEYYGDIGWADNTDLTLYTGMSEGSITNGYKLFFESFAPVGDPDNPVIVAGTYNVATDVMPDEFEFAPGFDDGTGKIRSSQYVKYVDGVETRIALTGGSYTVSNSGSGYIVEVEVETSEGVLIKCTYTGEIEVEDWS